MNPFRQITATLLLLVLTACSFGQAKQWKDSTMLFPKPTGYVNDFEVVLAIDTYNTLTQMIEAHKKKTTDEIVVVTIPSYEPFGNLADYAKTLSNEWGVGNKQKNNGVTIVFSKAKREVRISTGLGIKKKLTDTMCQKIIDEKMIPAFKEGDYDEGIVTGVKEIIRILESK